MIGSTPQLATAVWLGTAEGKPLTNQWGGVMYGSGLPATIWKNVMDQALIDAPFENFATSDAGVGSYYGDGSSYGGYEAPAQEAPAEQSPAEEPSPAPEPAPAPAPRPAPRPAPAPAPDLGQLFNDLVNP